MTIASSSTYSRGAPGDVERADVLHGRGDGDRRRCRRSGAAVRPRRPGCRRRSACRTRRCPEPPARSFSASVPCGVSSSSSSPERNCRSNSLFSPTYDEVILRMRLAFSRMPSPQSSTPQLLLTMLRSRRALREQRLDQGDGVAREAEPADGERCAVRDVGDRLGGRPDGLVDHVSLLRRRHATLSRRRVHPARSAVAPARGGGCHVDRRAA